MKRLLTLVAVATSLIACKTEEKTDSDTLVVGLSADYPPFEYFKNGHIVGFDVSLIEALAKKIGKTVKIKDMNFDGIIAALQSNRIDVAISAISATPERKNAVDFTNTYYSGSIVMVCPQDSNIHAIEDLKGKTIGLQSGSIYEPYANGDLRAKLGALTVKTLPKIPDLIQDMKARRISCLIMGKTEADKIASEQPGLVVYPIDGTEVDMAIALPKGSPLKDKLDAALAEMKADGSLEHLIQERLH